MPCLQAFLTRKNPRSNLKDDVDTVGNLDTKQLIVPIRKTIRIRVQKGNPSRKRNNVLKDSTRVKDIKICQNLDATIAENMGIMHVTVQDHMIMLTLLKKMSKTSNPRI